MTTTRLSLYNGALRKLGQRKLGSLSEEREPRRILDDIWDDGAVEHCLEQGLWKFALRMQQLDYSPSINPDFGFLRAFEQPEDYVRLARISADGMMNFPLTRYDVNRAIWFAEPDTIYVEYVSNDDEYGADMSLWPKSFVQYVEYYLAYEASLVLTSRSLKMDKRVDALSVDMTAALKMARSKDAVEQNTKFFAPSSWVNARTRGGSATARERGW